MVSRRTFGCLTGLIFFVILFLEVGLVVPVASISGVNLGGVVGGMGFANYLLARYVTDRLLRRMGLSRSGKTVEVRGRVVTYAEGDGGDDVILHSIYSGPWYNAMIVFYLGGCLLGIAVLFFFLRSDPDGVRWWLYALVGLFGAIGIGGWWEKGRSLAWADESGLTAGPVGFYFRKRFVPWSSIASCEIETFHDTFGKPTLIRPILKGQGGEVLLAADLRFTRFEDQERLVKYIRAKLPKPKVELFEL